MNPSRVFLALLLVGCSAPSVPDLITESRAAEQVGQTRNATGEVAFKRENDRDFIPCDLAANDVWPVFNLDWWRTGPDSTCEIFLDNGSIFVMKPASVLLVRVDRKKKTVQIELQQGSVKLITINSPDYNTNLLPPSAMVTATGALVINKVESEGHLYVENES
ncbi:MAG: FecR domain-containing protein, partial [Planctomycetes bacterium]|nr:FecR domain-containing protein [Planctomycetota bacterium]